MTTDKITDTETLESEEGKDSISICKHLTGVSFYRPSQFNPTSHPTFDQGYWDCVLDLERFGSRGGVFVCGTCGSALGRVIDEWKKRRVILFERAIS